VIESEIVKKALPTIHAIRLWAEEYASVNGFPDDLCGMCAIASAKLWRSLAGGGIYGVIAHSRIEHFFMVLDDYVIDITATQFGVVNPVTILPKSYAKASYWRINKVLTNDRRMRQYQTRRQWCPDEIPNLEAL
jgi:hypothetical protein